MAKQDKTQCTGPRVEQGRIMVTTHYGSEDKSEEKSLEVQAFEVEPAYVRAAIGMTINTGNYNSARVDAAVTLPAYVEEISAAYEKAWELVENEVMKQVESIKR